MITSSLESPGSKDETARKAHLEESLNNLILGASLALKLVKNSNKPINQLLDELLQIEIEVGKYIGDAFQNKTSQPFVNLEGSLASALCFIPFTNKKVAENTASIN